MNSETIKTEGYTLIPSFLAEVEAFVTNRNELVNLINFRSEILANMDSLEEAQNLLDRNKMDRDLVMLDMKEISRAKILEKYYTLLLLLDPAKYGLVIDNLNLLYECFSSAVYEGKIVDDIGKISKDIIKELKLEQGGGFQPNHLGKMLPVTKSHFS